MSLHLAEGEGFEPSTPVSQGKHLAGARTRPLCDPSPIRQSSAFMSYFVYLTISQPFVLLKLFCGRDRLTDWWVSYTIALMTGDTVRLSQAPMKIEEIRLK